MVLNKIGKGIKKGAKAVEDNTIGQVKKILDKVIKTIDNFVKNLPRNVYRKVFKPLVDKLKWLFSWIKLLCLCSCILCIASSCFALGLPQMILSIIQGAGSVAASQAVDGTNGGSTSNNINLSEFDLNGLNNNDSSNAGSLDALPTSMAMFNPRPTTGGPAVGSVRMAIPTGPSTNNMPNFSKNLSK